MMELKKEEYISSYVSKLLRKNFGRGPRSCQTSISSHYLVTYINGFLSPMEDVMLHYGQNQYVDHARNVIITHLLDEIKGVIQITYELEVEEYYHDWNFPNNSGILIFILDTEAKQKVETDIDIQRFELEVSRISLLVEKVPDKINIRQISPTIFLVERKGILIQIEKALIDKGFENELKFTKDELEKSYFHRYGRFEDIFHKSVRDIFIDWNFKLDKSVMAFILKS